MMNLRFIFFVCVLGLFLPLSFVRAGTILSSHKYAWSNNVGYINFEDVIVNDNNLSGYAWSANKGFINFSPAEGGVLNDGAGNISGSAWGEQLGWIDFNNVNIDANGIFSGTAEGSLVGTITFDCPNYCDVETDWRQAITPVVSSSSSGSGGGGGSLSGSRNLASNHIVNILDFNAIMVNWGLTQNLAAVLGTFNQADMNNDGIVDILDFNTAMVYWDTIYTI